MNVIEFIKAVFDTVLDMIIAAYYDNPFIPIRARLENLLSHHQAVNVN